jgi:hypothetical protein
MALATTGCGRHGDAALRAGADAARQAADRLVAMSPQPPRQGDPAASPSLDAVFNIAVLPNTPLTENDLDSLLTWSQAASRVGNLYVYAETSVPSDPARADPGTVLRAQKNVVAFAPEVGRYFDAVTQLLGMTDRLYLQMRKNPVEYNVDPSKGFGADKVAAGTTALYVNVLRSIAIPGVQDAWRNGRVGILNGVAPDASALLSPQQRSAVHEAIAEAEDAISNPDVKNGLSRLDDWFSPSGNTAAAGPGGPLFLPRGRDMALAPRISGGQ